MTDALTRERSLTCVHGLVPATAAAETAKTVEAGEAALGRAAPG
ncbi:hypothetical protein [Glycomyces sp. NRRL B-16210]|nr:hypothetical protein [Glycomyces sp. NRRL B-16210]